MRMRVQIELKQHMIAELNNHPAEKSSHFLGTRHRLDGGRQSSEDGKPGHAAPENHPPPALH